jgi:hypothetical protein
VFFRLVKGLGCVFETGAEDPGVGFIGHGSTGDVAKSAVEVIGDVVGREAREHEAHESLRVGGIPLLQILIQLLGSVVVFLRYVIG